MKSTLDSVGMADLALQAVSLESEIDDFFELLRIECLSSEESLVDYCSTLGSLKQRFRRVHARLKRGETEESFSHKYPMYFEYLEKLNYHFRVGNGKLLALRSISKTKETDVENRRVFLEILNLQMELSLIDEPAYCKYVQCLNQREKCVEEIEILIRNCFCSIDVRDMQCCISDIEFALKRFNSTCSDYCSIPGNTFGISDRGHAKSTSLA